MDRRFALVLAIVTAAAMLTILGVQVMRVRLDVVPTPIPTQVAQVLPTVVKTETPVSLATQTPIVVTVVVTPEPIATSQPTETPEPEPTDAPVTQPTISAQEPDEPIAAVDDGTVESEWEAKVILVNAQVAPSVDEVTCGMNPRFSMEDVAEQAVYLCFPKMRSAFTNPTGGQPVEHAIVLQIDGQIILILGEWPIEIIETDEPPVDTTYTEPEAPAYEPSDPVIDEPPADEEPIGCGSCQAPATFVPEPDVPSDTSPEEPDEPLPTPIF